MKCYIASGWFNANQLEDLLIIKSCLQAHGVEFFSPKDECLCPPDAPEETKLKTFHINLREISRCDFMICNTRDKDVGSMFEAGYSYRCNVPIIYLCRGLKGGFNLMLAKSGIAVSTCTKSLSYYIGCFKNNRNFTDPYEKDII
jgi:hypothetical protein